MLLFLRFVLARGEMEFGLDQIALITDKEKRTKVQYDKKLEMGLFEDEENWSHFIKIEKEPKNLSGTKRHLLLTRLVFKCII